MNDEELVEVKHRFKAAICEHGQTTGGAMYEEGNTEDEALMLAMLTGHRTIEDRATAVTIERCNACRVSGGSG